MTIEPHIGGRPDRGALPRTPAWVYDQQRAK
jgi:hypothetical protein